MPVTHQAAHLFSNTNLLLTWLHSLFNEIGVPSGDRFDRPPQLSLVICTHMQHSMQQSYRNNTKLTFYKFTCFRGFG